MIVSLDYDFLGLDAPTPSSDQAVFEAPARWRSEEDLEKMNRLYAVESQFSLTGANADHRLRMKGSECRQFAVGSGCGAGRDAGLERGRERRRQAREVPGGGGEGSEGGGSGGAGGGRSAAACERSCAGCV